MPAPKNPNVTGAAAARRRIGDLTASNRLFEAGYLVLAPDELAQLPESLRAELRQWLGRADHRLPHGLRGQAAEQPSAEAAPVVSRDRVTNVPLCEHGDDTAACQLAHRTPPARTDVHATH